MFQYNSFSKIMQAGGVTLYVLLLCSVASLAIIVEKLVYYHMRSRVKRPEFMARIGALLNKNNLPEAIALCKNAEMPFAKVVQAGLSLSGQDERKIQHAMEREIMVETKKLERYTIFVGTIGSTAIYIGLFGTVLGIIRAISDIAKSGASGINVVMSGISEALICTAAGLCVAVPAVIAYNYFMKRVDDFIADMELTIPEVMDWIVPLKK